MLIALLITRIARNLAAELLHAETQQLQLGGTTVLPEDRDAEGEVEAPASTADDVGADDEALPEQSTPDAAAATAGTDLHASAGQTQIPTPPGESIAAFAQASLQVAKAAVQAAEIEATNAQLSLPRLGPLSQCSMRQGTVTKAVQNHRKPGAALPPRPANVSRPPRRLTYSL